MTVVEEEGVLLPTESPRLATTEDETLRREGLESVLIDCLETISNKLRDSAKEDVGRDVPTAQSLLLSSGYR
ncbi:hypothetical protein DPMN_097154 [Dreissena polymorpha]|uniref:Uncharacterized protein n=1 Tax=Dreissena polymorpha TaxID=45954 RepID=A0A9D4R4G9_DREPO|nr:hypothetical protein DPMN_097154 [Dreissena polymorpha]